jgi:prolycopene isomerase
MQELIRDFPAEEKGIRRFFQAAKALSKPFSRFHQIFRSEETMGTFEKWKRRIGRIQFVLPFLPYIMYSGEKGFRKGIRKFFRDEKLIAVFATNHDILSCLIPVSWAYINDYQTPPPGGGQRMAEWLEHVIGSHGGDIHYKHPVKEVLVREGRCEGVVAEHRGVARTIRSKYVIAACDVEMLYERMLPKDVVPEKIKAKLRDAELYSSSVTLSIALNCPAEQLGFGEAGVQLSDEDRTYQELQSGDPYLSEIHILAPSARDKSLAPQGCGTLTLFMPAFMEYQDHWMTNRDDQNGYERGEAYRKLKHEVAEIIIDRVAQALCPSLREHILFYEVATPITHYRYTGNRNGTMMGARPGKKNYQLDIAHYQTPVQHLLLGGHWAELGGGVPIAVKAGSNAALLVLKKEKPDAFTAFAGYVDGTLDLQGFQQSGAFQSYQAEWRPRPTPAEKKAAGIS